MIPGFFLNCSSVEHMFSHAPTHKTIYTHAHTRTHTHAHTHTHTCTRTHTHTSAHTYTRIHHIHTYIQNAHTHTHTYIHTQTHTALEHTPAYIHTYIHTCTHTHTHTHSNTHNPRTHACSHIAVHRSTPLVSAAPRLCHRTTSNMASRLAELQVRFLVNFSPFFFPLKQNLALDCIVRLAYFGLMSWIYVMGCLRLAGSLK